LTFLRTGHTGRLPKCGRGRDSREFSRNEKDEREKKEGGRGKSHLGG